MVVGSPSAAEEDSIVAEEGLVHIAFALAEGRI